MARLLLVAALLVTPLALDAQPFAVDDAGVTPPGACQMDGWMGRAGGGVLAACTPLGRIELGLGVGYAEEAHGGHVHREVEYVTHARFELRPDDPGSLGVALVAGLGFGSGDAVGSAFVYLPFSWTWLDERASLHLNGGWAYAREDAVHRPTYGAQGDLVLHDFVSLVGEVFGEGSDMEAQGGLRIHLVPDVLLVDASYGRALAGDASGIRFALGVALTPRGFFRPLR